MKLASIKHGRDGQLVVVSRDLTRCADARMVAPTMQAALDTWTQAQSRLVEIADALEAEHIAHLPFDPARCAAPLPRAYQWADGSAYVNHVALVRRARGAELPESFWSDPLMYQGGSDSFIGPTEPIALAEEAWGIDFEAEVAVILRDVPMAASRAQAAAGIALLTLVNDVSLRNLIAPEIAKGFGFFHGKAWTSFSPLAVTPDELGDSWDGAKVSLALRSSVNATPFGRPNAGVDMTFDFPALVGHAAKTRPLGAGTIVGSGTVSNRDADGGPGRPLAEGGVGYSCIAEIRSVETIRTGRPVTPFLRFGDRVRIEMNDASGRSIFGAIDQEIVRYASES
ncbi:MAG: fumarylacetoacetate hydrolase family protein [Proteobacteria bacterium]|nr:fumarylacetoacetate hydrolase family protein [Pseudomonadota bacterium]